MAMRPALKKIVDVLKKEQQLHEIPGYYTAIRNGKQEEFIKEHCHKLRNPVHIPAQTPWIAKSSSGNTRGKFVEDCNVIGVVTFIGNQLVLDKRASISEYREQFNGELDFVEMLSSIDTKLLNEIAEEV